jgi:hypothetical protein
MERSKKSEQMVPAGNTTPEGEIQVQELVYQTGRVIDNDHPGVPLCPVSYNSGPMTDCHQQGLGDHPTGMQMRLFDMTR